MSNTPSKTEPTLPLNYPEPQIQNATALILTGHSLLGTQLSGIPPRTTFIFRYTDSIPTTLARFHAGELLLDPLAVFRVWKDLRTMTFRVPGGAR